MGKQAAFGILTLPVLAGVLVVSFIPAEVVNPFRLSTGYLPDVGHVFAYALLSGATMLSVPRRSPIVDFTENEIGIACGIAIFCGYLIAQKLGTRGSASRVDGA